MNDVYNLIEEKIANDIKQDNMDKEYAAFGKFVSEFIEKKRKWLYPKAHCEGCETLAEVDITGGFLTRCRNEDCEVCEVGSRDDLTEWNILEEIYKLYK